MAGDTGERHRQRRREIGDPCVPGAQRDEQGPAGGVCERRVGPVQDLILNHLVDLTPPARHSTQVLNDYPEARAARLTRS